MHDKIIAYLKKRTAFDEASAVTVQDIIEATELNMDTVLANINRLGASEFFATNAEGRSRLQNDGRHEWQHAQNVREAKEAWQLDKQGPAKVWLSEAEVEKVQEKERADALYEAQMKAATRPTVNFEGSNQGAFTVGDNNAVEVQRTDRTRLEGQKAGINTATTTDNTTAKSHPLLSWSLWEKVLGSVIGGLVVFAITKWLIRMFGG